MDFRFLSGADRGAVVLDIGSRFSKAGFAGEGSPRATVVSSWMTDDAEQVDHAALEALLKSIFTRMLQVNARERRVVCCEPATATKAVRQAIASILFERLQVPSTLFAPSAVLALYATGTLTGLVVEVGELDASAQPVFAGVLLPNSSTTIPLGMRDLRRRLLQVLCAGNDGLSEADLPDDELEDILVRKCFVAPSKPHKFADAKDAEDRPVPLPLVEVAPGVEVDCATVTHELQNGQSVTVDGATRAFICEYLFEGHTKDNTVEGSVCTVILDTLLKCNPDVRAAAVKNIVFTGGGSMMAGFKDRLMHDLLELLSMPTYRKLNNLSDRITQASPMFPPNMLAWTGGSIVGSLTTLTDQSIKREAYLNNSCLLEDPDAIR